MYIKFVFKFFFVKLKLFSFTIDDVDSDFKSNFDNVKTIINNCRSINAFLIKNLLKFKY